jgi:hypothetical protein
VTLTYNQHMEREVAVMLTELIEKVGLLRRDMKQKGDAEKYEARLARIDQKFSALVEKISLTEPDLAKALRTAWQMPARSLAFRNAEHLKPRRPEDAHEHDEGNEK